jgi:sugar lactone lactonase YvrE
VVEVPDDDPSGLGWLADGRLLVVGMRRKTVYRVEVDRSLERYADLSGVARGVLNDMIVAQDASHGLRRGMGMDPYDPDVPMQLGLLFLVEPDWKFRTVADDLGAPNGPEVTEDGVGTEPLGLTDLSVRLAGRQRSIMRICCSL